LCYSIEESTGLMAEVMIDNEVKLFTNKDWKYKINQAYNNKAPSHALLFAIEEQYDARLELNDWYLPEYDDCYWSRCTECNKSTNLGTIVNKSTTCDLSYEPVLGKSFVAAQLTKSRDGIRHNLIKSALGVCVFATEIICNESSEVVLFADNCPSIITIGGNVVELNKTIKLPKGRNLLMLTAFTNV